MYDNQYWDFQVPSSNSSLVNGRSRSNLNDLLQSDIKETNSNNGAIEAKFVAIKKIYVTSSCIRIENEISLPKGKQLVKISKQNYF